MKTLLALSVALVVSSGISAQTRGVNYSFHHTDSTKPPPRYHVIDVAKEKEKAKAKADGNQRVRLIVKLKAPAARHDFSGARNAAISGARSTGT